MAINNHGYKYVELWEKYMQASTSYAQQKCDRARDTKAPLNAIYEEHGKPGTWNTTDDVVNESARRFMGLDPLKPTDPAALRNYHGEITQKNRATGLDNFWYVITFPNMVSAAKWTEQYKISATVRPKYTGRFFDQPVTVEYQPE